MYNPGKNQVFFRDFNVFLTHFAFILLALEKSEFNTAYAFRLLPKN